MTSINIPRDDAATKIDTKSATDRTVKQVDSYPSVQAVKEHEDVTQAPKQQPHKQSQRRRKERRKKSSKVLLDTRSGHDRRNVANAEKVDLEEGAGKENSTGIDVYS